MLSLTVVSICIISLVNLTQGVTLVTVPPTIVEGESASITCSDVYQVASLYNQQTLLQLQTCILDVDTPCSPDSDYYTISHNNNSLTVHIANVSRTRDEGTWTCGGFYNSTTNIQDSVDLEVDIKVSPSTHIAPSTSPNKVIQGKPINLTCVVDEANPPVPTFYTWSKDDVILPGEYSSVYIVQSVERSDTGSYSCTGNNGVGTGRSTTSVQVDVLFTPSTHISPSTSPNKVIQGRQLHLTCVDEANPPVPSTGYTWSKDDVILPGESSSVYIVQSVEISDTGRYSCTGNNSVGTGRSTTSVQVDVLVESSSNIGVIIGVVVSILLVVCILVVIIIIINRKRQQQQDKTYAGLERTSRQTDQAPTYQGLQNPRGPEVADVSYDNQQGNPRGSDVPYNNHKDPNLKTRGVDNSVKTSDYSTYGDLDQGSRTNPAPATYVGVDQGSRTNPESSTYDTIDSISQVGQDEATYEQ